MQDAAIHYAEKSSAMSGIIASLNWKDFILCSLHRAENTDDLVRLKSITNALNSISKKIPIVLPLHPRTKKIIEAEKHLENLQTQTRFLPGRKSAGRRRYHCFGGSTARATAVP